MLRSLVIDIQMFHISGNGCGTLGTCKARLSSHGYHTDIVIFLRICRKINRIQYRLIYVDFRLMKLRYQEPIVQ